jgi:hypothetical protein
MNCPEPDIPEPRGQAGPPAAYPFWTYQDLLLILLLLAPCLLTGILLAELAFWAVPLFAHAKAAKPLAAQFLVAGMWFGCIFLLLKTKYDRPFWRSLAWFKPPWGFWSSVLAGPLVAFSIAFLGLTIRTPENILPFENYMHDRVSVVLIGLFAVTLGPLSEELAFRGLLFPLLARSFGAPAAILGAAVPFALLHGPQYSWSWQHILLVLLAGLAFGWMRHRTGSTMASAFMHGAYNLTFYSTFLLEERFTRLPW